VLFGNTTGGKGGWGSTSGGWGGVIGLVGNVLGFQHGGSFWANRPTPLMVGEGGQREFVNVTPESQMGGGATGQNSVFNISIMAVDSKSFIDLAEKNPQAIIGPFLTALQMGDKSLSSAIKRVK
jgi:hypothetical protein